MSLSKKFDVVTASARKLLIQLGLGEFESVSVVVERLGKRYYLFVSYENDYSSTKYLHTKDNKIVNGSGFKLVEALDALALDITEVTKAMESPIFKDELKLKISDMEAELVQLRKQLNSVPD